MDFETLKKNKTPILGVYPVMVVTEKKERWEKIFKFPFSEKRLDKFWQNFENNFIKGKKFDDNYYSVELEEYPEVDETSDEITKQRKFAVVNTDSVGAYNDLSESELSNLIFGIRFVTADGKLAEIGTLVDLTVNHIQTEFKDGEFSQLVVLYWRLRDEMLQKEKDLAEIKEDTLMAEGNSTFAADEDVAQEGIEAPESDFKEEQSNYPEVEENAEIDEENEELEEDINYDSEEIYTAEDLVKDELENYLSEKYIRQTIEVDLEHLEVEYDESELVRPFFAMKRNAIKDSMLKSNRVLKEFQYRYKKKAKEIIEPEVKTELDKLLDYTNSENPDSPYYVAKQNAFRQAQRQKERVRSDIESYRIEKQNELDYNRENYINDLVQRETRAYNEKYKPLMEANIQKYADNLKQKLEESLTLAYDSVENQASEKFQNEVEQIVQNVIDENERVLANIYKEYLSEVSDEKAKFDVNKAAELEDLKGHVYDILKQHTDYTNRSEEEVAALLRAKAPEMASLQAQVDLAEKTKKEIEDSFNIFRVSHEETEKKVNKLTQDLQEAEAEKKLLEQKAAKAKEEAEKELAEKNTAFSKYGKFALVALAIITVGGVSASVVSNSSKNAKLEQQITKLSKENKSLQKKASAKYHVDDYVPVAIENGKTAFGKVKEIKNGKVIVEVKNTDGSVKEYQFSENR